MNIIFRRKTAMITFYIMIIFVICNYIFNVLTYNGYDILEMYEPVKLLLLSDENVNSPFGFYFMQIYPFIVVLPAGFSLSVDKQSNTMLFLCSRVGNRNYFIGKIIAAFFAALIIFFIPLSLEVILNYFSFPKEAMGNLYNLGVYSQNYIDIVKSYPFSQIYVTHPYIYVIGWSILFGVAAGMLNVITIAVSTFRIPYKVLLFLPVYFILNAMYWIGDYFGRPISHFFFLRMFVPNQPGYLIFYGVIFILFLLSIVVIIKKGKKDYLG
ncbi:MAG: hypothetical protein MSG78_06415 [Clostridiales bacterium]|nr:hypothetical protein [Clostridiales bacterium]